MRVLFVHQGFPGQYRHILRALASQGGNQLVGMGINPLNEKLPSQVTYVRYQLNRGSSQQVHPWAVETESKVIRGEACAHAACRLQKEGFIPDLICAHPGWGEALYLKDIWPKIPLLSYQEFFYHAKGFDLDFDNEIQKSTEWPDCAKLRMKNANPLLMLNSSDWNICPTYFQRSTFPSEFHNKISVIHDGIDINIANPDNPPQSLILSDQSKFFLGEKIITFVNRRIEPYRGCHTFIRSIPLIQKISPDIKIVIVGGFEGASYGSMPAVGTWKDQFLREIEGQYDPSCVYFTGNLDYSSFIKLLKLSSCHVYLTYPFVLSWSLLEAMSIALPIVGSSTAPVQEVIRDGYNGLLVDFFSPNELAEAISDLVKNRDLANKLGQAARQTILERYTIQRCVPLHLNLMQLVANRVLPGM